MRTFRLRGGYEPNALYGSHRSHLGEGRQPGRAGHEFCPCTSGYGDDSFVPCIREIKSGLFRPCLLPDAVECVAQRFTVDSSVARLWWAGPQAGPSQPDSRFRPLASEYRRCAPGSHEGTQLRAWRSTTSVVSCSTYKLDERGAGLCRVSAGVEEGPIRLGLGTCKPSHNSTSPQPSETSKPSVGALENPNSVRALVKDREPLDYALSPTDLTLLNDRRVGKCNPAPLCLVDKRSGGCGSSSRQTLVRVFE